MSTILTNGLKLPDKGSVDWYSDMQNNYTILDGAVGTIAEHTTALAGKAPAVHTHTKSDITDFPAYGNAAGTICEGNDSRLSDARTPVAHTHGKADITDLFNSANTWSASNTYSATCIIYNSDNSDSVATLRLRNSKAEVLSTGNTGATQSITFRDKNDFSFGYIYGTVQSNGAAVKIGAYAKDSSNNTINTELQILSFTNGNKALFPATTNEYDLGISSFQWKSIFAKNYYYNGTAWGLDKQNEWTNFQRMTSNPAVWYLRNNTVTLGSAPSSNRYIGMFFEDVNGADLGYASFQANKNSYNSIMFSLHNSDGTNTYTGALRYRASTTGAYCFFPETSECDLGISTNKWKTLNGVNPGALSLPSENASSVNLDPTNWNLTGTSPNYYTPPANGWLGIQVMSADTTDLTGQFLFVGRATGGVNYYPEGGTTSINVISGQGTLMGQVFIPVISDKLYHIRVKIGVDLTHGSSITARFYTCLGNV